MGEVVDWPGFRRRLRTRIAAWTRAELSPKDRPPVDAETTHDEWEIFQRYRKSLARIESEDDAGFAVWASSTFEKRFSRTLRPLGKVTILDPIDTTRSMWRVVETCHKHASSVTVTLPYSPSPHVAEAYSSVARGRERLIELGFEETAVEPLNDMYGPVDLRAVEEGLFRDDAPRRTLLSKSKALKVLGAPKGEGVGLIVAREVKRILDTGTIDASEIMILFPHWDGDSTVVHDTLKSWGLPIRARMTRRLAADPGIAALRLAAKLPLDGWETADLAQLLRNGRVRPASFDDEAREALVSAASTIKATRVFRGVEPLRRALDRILNNDKGRKAERARRCREVLDEFVAQIETLDQVREWPYHVVELRRLADSLGIRLGGGIGLDELWLALEDHAAVLADLGVDFDRWTWSEFVADLDSILRELDIPSTEAEQGGVTLASVDEIAGARAEYVILVNLTEGTFPSRDVVDRESNGRAAQNTNASAFGREMLRFLSVIGSADSELVLVYPTCDEKGQELLKAGFLDDLLRLFDAKAEARFHEKHPRFDPALLEHPDLAGAPADARVRAVALACLRGEPGELEKLARQPLHRVALSGTAAALHVGASRFEGKTFDAFDGRLSNPDLLLKVHERFGPEYVFSPSQIESYISCPFQFALQYMLKLEPVDDRDELEEDYTERGSRIHDLLENLERLRLNVPRDRLEIAEELIVHESLRRESAFNSEVDAGLQEIEKRRLVQLIRRYVKQHQQYEEHNESARPEPYRFEEMFGFQETQAKGFPALEIGQGPAAVKLQGKIDRIDLVRSPGHSAFRVIDYKSGATPSKKDVKSAAYVQLPLYAMAVERLVLKPEGISLHDVGYWGLKKDGFRAIPFPDWREDQAAIEAYVIALVNLLRKGVFVVESRKEDCTSFYEFSAVCRVRQVRASGKSKTNVPPLELKG